MSDQTDSQTPAPGNTASQPSKAPIFIAAVLVLALAGAGGLLLWKKYHSAPRPAAKTTAQEIQDNFKPPANFKPTFVPPTPGSAQVQTLPGNSQTATTTSANPIAPPQNQVYNSFPNSPATLAQTTQIAGAQTPSQNVGRPNPPRETYRPYIESYAANGAGLDDIQKMLQGSPSVISVSLTTYQGQPALKYTASNPGDGGIAYIANNVIFYVHN